MNAITEWWEQASPRDQLAVFVLSICAALYFLYMAVYSPIVSMKDEQLTRNRAAVAEQQRVRELAAKVKSQTSPAAGGKSIVEVVSRSMSANGLNHSGMQPNGTSNVRLRIEKAPFNKVVAWLNHLETNEGLLVNDASVAATSDSGVVSVNIRLSRP